MKKKMISVVTVTDRSFLALAAGVDHYAGEAFVPSRETMDGNTYFGVTEGDQAALIVNRVLAEEKLKTADGRYYVEDAVVGKKNI